MSNLNDVVIFIVLSALFLLLAIGYGIVYFRHKRLAAHYLQAALERDLFREKIAEYVAQKESKKIEHTEGFIRFVSQSRDWAFQYIEDVQKSLAELKDYFDKNGLNLNVEQAEEMAKRIEDALSHLPEDSRND